jgi:hypothetical protein
MQNSLAGRDCSHGQDLVAAEQMAYSIRLLPSACRNPHKLSNPSHQATCLSDTLVPAHDVAEGSTPSLTCWTVRVSS